MVAIENNCKQLRRLILLTVPEAVPAIIHFALSNTLLRSNVIELIFRAGYVTHRCFLIT